MTHASGALVAFTPMRAPALLISYSHGAVRHSTRWQLVQLYTARSSPPPSLGSGSCSSLRRRLVEPVHNLLHRRLRAGLPAIGRAGSLAIRVTGLQLLSGNVSVVATSAQALFV